MSQTLPHAASALSRINGFSREERQAVLDLLRAIDRHEADADEQRVAIVARLGTREFRWPEYDIWQTVFASREGGVVRRNGDGHGPRKLQLFLDWLIGLEGARAALAGYAKRGIRASIARQDEHRPCPICEQFNRREVTESSEHLPPFHPGCRCLVLAVPSTSSRPLPRSA